ncbi:hypothetical protein R9X47_24570 [Wukongibacter baidiensis]|uniref:hypothetical protein n=1 Tax=Wukongibacter baidiensis TaxID=1723361 RepID=UPI003D7FD6EF
MSNSYKTKYEVLKTFKEDQLQRVLIGSDKKNDDEVVVINVLHQDKVSKTISKSQFPKGLNNLIHLEEGDGDLVVVTEYKDGTPLESYLKFFDTTVKHKINLVYEFLTRVVKYDNFHNSIKKILIDESQILIKDEDLYFNELMFLDEDFGKPIEFTVIASKLGEIIEKIVFSLEPEEDKDNDRASQSILRLINKLKSGDHTYRSIHAVYNAFRKIYIYEIFMEDESVPDDDEEPSNETFAIPLKETLISEAVEHNEFVDLKNEVTELKTEMDNETHNDQDHDEPLELVETVEEELNEQPTIKDSPISDNELAISMNEILIGKEDPLDESDDDDAARGKGRGYAVKIAIAILLLSILSYGALKLSKPILSSFKTGSTQAEIAKPEAYFVYEKIADSYFVTNESKIYGEDNGFAEVLWKIQKGDEVLEEVNQRVDSKKSIEIKFKSEGEYTIVLSIKDKYGNTDVYKENIVFNNKIEIDQLKNTASSEEKLDNLGITYSSSTIVKDYEAFRSGNYSLRLGQEGKNNFEKIILNNINIENKPIVSMWIASNSKDKISITARGYKNDKIQFSKVVSFVPKETNTWEMVEISDTSKDIDKIELVFKDFISPIWLDDIEVSSYK